MTELLNQTGVIQKLYQKILVFVQWIIFSDIYITLGAVAFAYVNTKLLHTNQDVSLPLLILVGSATMFIYQFSRWTFFKDVPNDLSRDKLYYWMEKNRMVVMFLMGCSIVSGLVTAFFVRVEAIEAMFVLGTISFLYNINIPIGKGKVFTVRKIPFTKIFLIAFVWASMAVILPWIQEYGWKWDMRAFQLFLLQFLFIFIITLPFDINDIEVDKEVGVRTIPIALGAKKSKVLLTILSVLYTIFFTIWVVDSSVVIHQVTVFLTGIMVLIFSLLYKTIVRSNRAEKWQIMLWYDGSLILYFLIYFLSLYL